MTAHTHALLDSYVFGFALPEPSLPINGPETVTEVGEQVLERFPGGAYPNLVEFSTEDVLKPGYDFGEEFEYGLDVILGRARPVGSGRRQQPPLLAAGAGKPRVHGPY